MKENQIKETIESLRKEIEKYDYHYYVLNQPLIDDYEYDKLYHKLLELEKKYPQFYSPSSPTQRVSERNIENFEKFEHKPKMFSLDNTYSDGEVLDFDRRIKTIIGDDFSYVVEPKIDGVAVSIIYKDGIFFKGLTRGDGNIGDDVSENIKTIRELPLTLEKKFDGELIIRGEVFFTKDRFSKIQDIYSFSNARNAAAGTLKLLSPKEVSKRGLSVRIHTVVTEIEKTHTDSLKYLKALKIPVVEKFYLAENIKEVLDIKERFKNERYSLPYETDGIVIKVNQLELREKIGYTSKSPRWAFAFKYEPERAVTKLLSVSFQVGRTGVVTPVANLEPVFISGSTVKRSTLHNFDEIERLDLMVNDYVLIEKSGEIIPKVIKVIKEKRSQDCQKIEKPKDCPSCGQKLVQYEGEVALRCINKNCPAQIELSLLHFCSKSGMNIENLGEMMVKKLLEYNLVKTIPDIYRLNYEKLFKIPRIKEKSAKNILDSIEKSKRTTLKRFIYSLGIKNVGEFLSEKLSENFGNIDDLINADFESIRKIEGVGDETAKNIILFFKNEENLHLIKELKELGISFEKRSKKDILEGKSFVVTGSLKNFTRDEIKETILENGGTFSENISKKTDYLIVGLEPGSKFEKAKKLGVKIIDEDEFLKMLRKR
uniref:DNA ligase n=1 Tax=candidate division WOR-3 bacterium TaxID=2052148 RepID=A0A7C3J605_UNCW3